MSTNKRISQSFHIVVLLHLAIGLSLFKLSYAADIKIEADQFLTEEEGLTTATGNVTITEGTKTITGDTLSLDNITKKGMIEGNSSYKDSDIFITADKIDFNAKYELATIFNGTATLPPYYYMGGERILKTSADRYLIKDGIFTTCDCSDESDNPDWAISARDIDLTVGGYAYFSNIFFRVNDLPILYFPYMIWPVKTERTTGLLQPKFAYSNQDGFQLKNELFIAIAENMDATIGHHYLGNRGVEYQTQYRYIFAPETFGEFNYTHLEPSRDYYDDNSAQWQINGDHFQVFDYNIKSHLHIDKESKNNTNRLYGDDILVRTSAYTDSYFEFNKDYDSSQIDATFQELEQASSQDPNTIVKAPNLSFRKFSEQIGNLPLYFEFDSSIANYQVERDSDINGRFELARLDLFPSLRHSFDLQGAGLLSTTVGARSTSYTNGLAADKSYTDESFSTESYNIGMTYTAPILFKNYQTKSQSISKIRNLIIPTLAYEYLPGGEVDGDDKSKINVIDNVDQDGLSFRNRLTGKLSSVYEGSIKAGQAGNPMYSKKELARIDITQSYNLKVASLDDGDESELPEDRLEPLNVRTLFYPTDWLLLRTDANYNHQNDNFDSSRIEIGYKYDDKFNIAIDRVYDRSLTEDKSSSSLYFGYNLNRRIGADYSLIYGEESSQVRGSIFRLAYKKDCWQLKSSISKKLINGKTETTYGFSIILLGIGDIAAGVGSPILDRKL